MDLDARGIRLDIGPILLAGARDQGTPRVARDRGVAARGGAGLLAGIETLKACRIRNGWLWRDGRKLTAEDLRSTINTRMMADGYIPAHTICAPGDQAVDPHEEGHGPIRANTPVVLDIFPRSEKTGYFGDLTRTVVRGGRAIGSRGVRGRPRGRAPGHRMIKEASRARRHKAIQALFERQGYETGVQKGRMQGFFHGTGTGSACRSTRPLDRQAAVRPAGRPRRDRRAGALLPRPRRVRIEDVALVTRPARAA